MTVNNQLLPALVDTGSHQTLIKEAAVAKLGCEIKANRRLPCLQGVTGSPLRIIGTVFVEIGIGLKGVSRQHIPVVPNHYISTDLLLGCDLLNQSSYLMDQPNRVFYWGQAPYVVRVVRKGKHEIRKVNHLPPPSPASPTQNNLHVPQTMKLQPYQTKFISLPIEEQPGTTVIIYPQGKISANPHPYCALVDENQTVPCPFTNNTKTTQCYRTGVLFGWYEKGEVNAPSVQHIQNDLLPRSDISSAPGGRTEKLRDLLSQQPMSHLSKSQRQQLKQVIMAHDPLFLLEEGELGTLETPPAEINVTNPQPVRAPIYRYPETAKQTIGEMLEDMEARGIIEKSTAAWLIPIVLVNKPNGSKRMCLDYRQVNTHLATDIYPLPRLDELVEQASGNKYYTTLDLKEAYFQITLHENSRDLTTFSDGVSLYRFRRLPFGLSCSPAIFSRQITTVLAPLLREGWVKNYLDDIILWAPDFPIMLQRINKLFECLQSNGVKLNLSKCTFGEAEVKFLGHLVSEQGCKPDPKNVEAVQKMHPPKTVKEVRSYLGMCGFYRKHIPEFAKIAVPLYNLTKKNVDFIWTKECQTSFEALKTSLIQAPVLVRADVTKPFIVTTDASQTHVGGVLSQIQEDGSDRPIGYFSKKLKPPESRYSTTDREALAIILTCRHFHHYLWGTKFIIYTDHRPLTSIFKKKTKSQRVQRWTWEMKEYSFEIKYVKGKNNFVADSLSRPVRIIKRVPTQSESYLGLSQNEFIHLQREDPQWKALAEFLEGGNVPTKIYPRTILEQFVVIDKILYYTREKTDGSLHYCIVVPQSLKQQALEFAHVMSGHLGQKKTITKAEEYFYWANLKSEVVNFVRNCQVCQRFKGSTGLQQQWQELPAVSQPLERIGIDLTDMTTGTLNYRYILTVIDHFSRYCKFFPLKTKHTHTVVEALERYVADFGVPQSIVADNGGEFVSKQFEDFCQRHHITVHYTTPYNPRGNSVTERVHRSLKSVLSTLCAGHPLKWPQYLPSCQAVLNHAVHTSTGVQPYFAFFGRHAPRKVGAPLPGVPGEPEGLQVAHEVVQATHKTLTRRYREVANRHRKNQAVRVGSLVWVRKEVLNPGVCRKLQPKWDGPYRVVEVLREGGAYILENLFTGQKVQRTAEKVKPYHGQEEWLVKPDNIVCDVEEADEPLPPRLRKPPKRLIEEC